MSAAEPEVRTELFSRGAFSAGAVSDSTPTDRGQDRLALGGYAAYAFQDVTLYSSLKGDADTSAASFSAAYTGFGVDNVAALRLGYEWGRTQAFSLNPAQAGLSAFAGVTEPGRPVGDLSLTLSFTREVTPSLSFGGFAAAGRNKDEDGTTENSLRFGAGLGYKF
ncbi:MAG: hypothetical protein NVV74_23040 [Magnetospirillum sp.]|nr:hypothetical protein [Magnetospirillum sp.]